MSAPKPGDRVVVRWPGGPYDFVLEFQDAEPVTAEGWRDWIVVTGLVVEPEGPQHRMTRSFYVQRCEPDEDGKDGGYALLPKQEWT